jgi:hypothetical protein
VRFTAVLELGGKTATGIEIPEEVITSLQGGRRPALRATLNGYTYRTTVGVLGGRYLLPVSAEHRTAAGLTAGDTVEVEIALDTEERTVALHPDFAAALDTDPQAARAFAALSPGRRRQLAEPIAQAKAAETRARRVEKALASLRGTDPPA